MQRCKINHQRVFSIRHIWGRSWACEEEKSKRASKVIMIASLMASKANNHEWALCFFIGVLTYFIYYVIIPLTCKVLRKCIELMMIPMIVRIFCVCTLYMFYVFIFLGWKGLVFQLRVSCSFFVRPIFAERLTSPSFVSGISRNVRLYHIFILYNKIISKMC